MFIEKKIILASASPRRQALLQQVGFQFETCASNIDEDSVIGPDPETVVTVLSREKAKAVARSFQDALIVGADTIVVLDGVILGKPKNRKDATRMLQLLSGREHVVYTGFTIHDRPSDKTVTAYEKTTVVFRPLALDEIEEYVQSGSPMDKAGAYGIQDDYGALFVERIEGCFYNVVGFPLTKFYRTLLKFQQEISHK
jgi:septum formation protein